jgi:hypothetical protein
MIYLSPDWRISGSFGSPKMEISAWRGGASVR